MSRLEPNRRYELPLTELSGLTVRPSTDGGEELVGIGDEAFAVVTAPIAEDGALGNSSLHDLRPVLPDDITSQEDGSEFEGVDCDHAGTLLILQEGPGRVLVLSPKLDRVVQTIDLAVEPTQAPFGAAWAEDSNKRGEALLLLSDGHLLVAKQRNPVTLIEFAPEGSPSALGLTPEALARPLEFPVPGGRIDYRVVAAWALDDTAGEMLESVNDATVGEDGRLYVLSSTSRRIARLQSVSPSESTVAVERSWNLDDLSEGGDRWAHEPKAQKEPGLGKGKDRPHPEGLALLAGLQPVVSIDSKEHQPNVFVMERLDR